MIYVYKARTKEGKTVRGTTEANTLTEFYESLEKKELLCLGYTSQEKSTETKVAYRLKYKDLILFCRKVGTMLSAGMSITNCLDVMYSTETKPKLRQIYLNLYEWVKGGKSLSEAMRLTGGAFPMLLMNMMESGEESGNVDMITQKLSDYYEKQAKISSKIKTATIYPKILAIVACLVIVILFTFVLPKIFEVLGEDNIPAITQLMVNISNSLLNYWYIYVVVIVLLIIFGGLFLKIPQLKFYKDKLYIRLFLVGPLVKKIYSARFASTLSLLYASGVSLLNAIGLSMNVIDNSYIRDSLNRVVEKVSVGQSLSDSVMEINVFDGLLGSMIKIGEESGSLDSILESVSTYYETETESAIESLLAILEPALLVVMAIIIGTVLVAVMLPIFNMYGQIG